MKKKEPAENQDSPAGGINGEAHDILDLISSSLHTGIAYLDREFRFVWVNQGYALAAGLEVDAFRGRNYFDLFPDPSIRALFSQVVQTGGTYAAFSKPAEALGFPETGTSWDWYLQPLRDGSEGVKGLVITIENASQRVQAEKSLNETQAMFEHLFESAPDANILVDEHGSILAVNRQAEEMFGYTRDELAAKPIEILLPGQLRDLHASHRKKFNRDPRTRPMGEDLDLYGRRKDGSQVPVDITLSPLMTDQGLRILSSVRDITRRKQADEALRRSEESLQAVMHALPVILFAIDRNGIFTLLQGQGLAGLGTDVSGLLGRSAFEVLRAYPDVLGYIRRALAGEDVRVDLQTRSGEYFEVSYTPQRDASGETIGLIGLASNITARKKAEIELRQWEERFRSSLENLLEAFTILTPVRDSRNRIVDFRIEYANEIARRANQELGGSIVGMRLTELLPGIRQIRLVEQFRKVVKTGQPLILTGVDYEDNWVGKVRFRRFLNIRATRLGEGVATSWRDVTEDYRMQAAMRQQEAMLRTVVDTLPVGVVVVDRSGQVTLGNKAGFQIWRDQLPPALQSEMPKAWWPRSGRRITAREWPITRAVTHGETILEEEMDIITPDGLRKTILNSTVPLHDEDGQVSGAVMVSQEITERKQMEAELSEVQRRLMDGIEMERRRLAQELHDGPMQDLYGIAFQIQTIEEEVSGERKAAAEQARASVQEVVQVLRDVCGELRPPTLVHFGLKRAILSHIEKFHNAHPEVKISLQLVDDRTELPEMVRLALFRIYQHTISNIVRHAQANRIEIDFDLIDRNAILEIHDNGVGFEVPRHWLKLAREGHLGLIGSAERAESVGGKLEIESAPGEGTTIRAVVPLPHDNTITAEPVKEMAGEEQG
ncbi:MAG TPA: PAS domain-containing protein [Anaerolineaceae bacterium]